MKILFDGTRCVSRVVGWNTDRLLVPLLIVAALSLSAMALGHVVPH